MSAPEAGGAWCRYCGKHESTIAAGTVSWCSTCARQVLYTATPPDGPGKEPQETIAFLMRAAIDAANTSPPGRVRSAIVALISVIDNLCQRVGVLERGGQVAAGERDDRAGAIASLDRRLRQLEERGA